MRQKLQLKEMVVGGQLESRYIMENFRFMKPYPLFKVEYEELVGRNESKSSVYRIYVKIAEPMNWFCLYVTSSSACA